MGDQEPSTGAARQPAGEPLLVAEGLYRTYGHGDEQTHALQGAGVTVRAGELVIIQGRSGSGKTTLLNLVSGLDRPDRGSVRLLGHALSELSTDQRLAVRAESIGFVFQDPALVPELQLWENVAMAARIRGFTPEVCLQRALEALADVGLEGLEHRYPGEVSGGEAQRASVARAMVKRPHLLLADEPTANLDHDTAERVAALFQRYVADQGAASLVVTHDDIMAAKGHRRHLLRDGKLDHAEGDHVESGRGEGDRPGGQGDQAAGGDGPP